MNRSLFFFCKIPKEKIGFIIGRGGWKTRSIQTATGTVIIHPNDRDSDAFTIIGKKHDTDHDNTR